LARAEVTIISLEGGAPGPGDQRVLTAPDGSFSFPEVVEGS
jgi:hypothetical protein